MEDKKIKGDKGEEYVNQIAFKSLLNYWCYPNPKDEHGDKKEICDLLVLFKDICIIFSVKNYEFDGDYEKYFRKTIDKAIKQISGAERKLFDFPREIYIKHPTRAEELFDKGKYKKVFRIIVNLGEEVDMYSPAHVTDSGKYVTIFNKDTFETILNELDTISDFSRYLEERERLVTSKSMMQWFGREKDLFAHYIKNGKQFPLEFFKEGFDFVIIDFEGEWDNFIKEDHKTIAAKKEMDKKSYFLDELTDRQLTKLPQGDLLAQEFLSLNRFERRIFTDLFFSFYSNNYKATSKATAHRYAEIGEYGVVFFYYSPDFVDTLFPDNGLQTAILGYTLHTDYAKKKMLGLGTTTNMEQFKFQFIQFDQPMEKELIDEVEKFIKELGWFKNIKSTRYQNKEYPS